MTMPSNEDPTVDAGSLDAVIAGYLQAIESGQVPDRAALLASHPNYAEALRTFFADLDRMDRIAAPLRLDDDPTGDIAASPVGSTIRYFGDYELLELIAKGGMGVVYKARQVSLNRVVALKMILAGTFATDRERERFRSEAENAASLDHPNIVPIYEVGEHEGQQYFTMKFIDGAPLNDTPRLAIKAEVERMSAIAAAVSFAHARGILHRDLKPSNILIGQDGSPNVADFGLAKRLENANRSLTETGQIIGTPRYMPPEQARGDKTLTVAADVYSLGAILYDRLAGRPPFVGEGTMAILDQVRNAQPPPIASLNPTIDRDLATLVHKALEKEPTHRYFTAADFASDLQRWLNGEPIEARPVSQAERFRRWCKRNPALATAGGLAAAGMLMATIMSVAFAMQWQRRAKAEGDRAKVAEEAQKSADRARDKMQGLLARGIAQSLDPARETYTTLLQPEYESLWELARTEDHGLGLRLLRECAADSRLSRSLRARSEHAVIAAIGLDESKRDRASADLIAAIGDRKSYPILRAQIALVAMELADGPSELSSVCARQIRDTLASGAGDKSTSRWLFQHDSDRGSMLDGRGWQIFDESTTPDEAVSVLLMAMQREIDAQTLKSLSLGLAGEMAQMPPSASHRAALRAATILVDALGRAARAKERQFLSEGLKEVSACMEMKDAEHYCSAAAKILADSLGNATNGDDRESLADGLAAVALRMEPAQAFEALIQAMNMRGIDSYNRSTLADGLAEVSARMQPGDAERSCASAAKILLETVRGEPDPYSNSRYRLVRSLVKVTARMELRTAAKTLLDTLAEEVDPFERHTLADGLAALAAKMQPQDAQDVCSAAARILSDALNQKTDRPQIDSLAEGLAALAPRMQSGDAERFCSAAAMILADVMDRNPDGLGDLRSQSEALTVLARRMEPSKAAKILADSICRGTSSFKWEPLAEGLASVSSRMKPREAEEFLNTPTRVIAAALINAEYDYQREQSSEALAMLAGRIESAEAERICDDTVQSLYKRRVGLRSIARLLRHLDPTKARGVSVELAMRSIASPSYWLSSETVDALLTDDRREERVRREQLLMDAWFDGDLLLFECIESEPYPCRLTSQELVELLKMPTCVGEVRKVVLKHLGKRYGRKFTNHWQFVRYVREHKLDLDLTTPPKRPQTAFEPDDEGGFR